MNMDQVLAVIAQHFLPEGVEEAGAEQEAGQVAALEGGEDAVPVLAVEHVGKDEGAEEEGKQAAQPGEAERERFRLRAGRRSRGGFKGVGHRRVAPLPTDYL